MNTELVYEIYPMLRQIDEEHQGIITNHLTIREVQAGEYIQKGCIQCSNLFLVLKGSLKIEKIDADGKVMKMYNLEPGEICHEVLSCYMSCENLNLSGQAITDMVVAFVPLSKVEKYLMNDVNFLKFIYMNLYRKFRKVVIDKEMLMHESVYDRLTKFINAKNSSVLYMTHQEIADELGTAREVISRNLKKMEREGLIELERNKIKKI